MITQLLSIVLFSIIILNNIRFMSKLLEIKFDLVIFIFVNIATSIIQIVIFCIMVNKKTSKCKRLIVHLLLSLFVVSLLVFGCYVFLRNSQILKGFEDGATEEENMITHLNFTISLMIWFRFIECFMCGCMYASSAMAMLSQCF